MIDESTDNTSVNIVEFGDRLYALTETPWMNQVDPEKLTVVGKAILIYCLIFLNTVIIMFMYELIIL